LLQSRILHKAFTKSTEVLGENAVGAIVEELARNGIFLNDSELTIEQLAHGINLVIGGEAAEIIIERILLKLDELCSVQLNKK